MHIYRLRSKVDAAGELPLIRTLRGVGYVLKDRKVRKGSAAWRISLWSGFAFAVGTAIAFWFLQSFLAQDIQNRADSWLIGELGVLSDVAQRTPESRLHDVVIREVAELASREVPHDDESAGAMNSSAIAGERRC